MRTFLLALPLLGLFSLSAAAQTAAQGTNPPANAAPAVAAEQPLAAFPYTPGLDVNAMDRSADPCEDFYQYSCGGWMKNNPIPADQPQWSVYGKLHQDNLQFLWGILDGFAKNPGTGDAIQRQIGDYFAACMDESVVEKRKAQPLEANLRLIDGMQSPRDLPLVLAKLHLETGGTFFFDFGSSQDMADSSQVIAFANAGGLGLPDRDYYLKNDPKSKEIRIKYLAHVKSMLELLGDTPACCRTGSRHDYEARNGAGARVAVAGRQTRPL